MRATAQISGSDAYKTSFLRLKSVTDAVPSLAQARVSDLREKAQKSVDEARANYEKARLEATQKLGDARSQLEDAQAY